MSSPYELLAGLALLLEKKHLSGYSSNKHLESWPALLIRIGDTTCVLHQDEVDEIIARGRLSRVNGVADWVVGLGYFRGQLLTVLDGAHLLGLRGGLLETTTARVIVVSGGDEWFGLQVDELLGIRHVWSDHLDVAQPAEALDVAWLHSAWPNYIERWIKLGEHVMPVLQIKNLVQALAKEGERAVASN